MADKKNYVVLIKVMAGSKLRTRRIAPKDGKTRIQCIEYLAKCIRDETQVSSITFNHRQVVAKHKEILLEIASNWGQLLTLEIDSKPYAASRERLANK